MATGSMSEFYLDTYNSRSGAGLVIRADSATEHMRRGYLPFTTIVGNSIEDKIEERFTSRGQRIGRMSSLRTIESEDGNSTFFQDGIGSNARRTWMSRDGRMIERDEYTASIYLRGNNSGFDESRQYGINFEAGSVSRQSNGWLVTQETSDMGNAKSASIARGNLNIDVSGTGDASETSLNFSNLSLSYHASAEGIEISYDNGRCRLLLANSILYALNPFVAGQNERAILYTGTDGRSYTRREIPHGEAARLAELMQLGLNNTNGVTVNGLTVFVDENGSVIAHTEEEGERQPLSITIAADGTQTVTSSDGYTSRIGADGRVLIFDAQGNCEAFFDPTTGIVGNENVQFGAEFSYVDGLYLNLMGMVFEMVALHRYAQDKAQATAQANTALTQTQTNMAFVRGRLSSGTIGPDCFGALNGSINELTSALGACLASGAHENIAAIVAALGDVYTQMTLSHFKWNSHLAGQQLGFQGSLLAKMQQITGATSDPMAVAHQFTAA